MSGISNGENATFGDACALTFRLIIGAHHPLRHFTRDPDAAIPASKFDIRHSNSEGCSKRAAPLMLWNSLISCARPYSSLCQHCCARAFKDESVSGSAARSLPDCVAASESSQTSIDRVQSGKDLADRAHKIKEASGDKSSLRTRETLPMLKYMAALLLLVFIVCIHLLAEQSEVPPLVIGTHELPKAYVRQAYQARLQAQGGMPPLKWELSEGSLPPGLVLQSDGLLTGTPAQTGEFHFSITVSDSGTPAHQISHQFSLTLVAPLIAQWGRYPKINGHRLDGSILVSNQTGQEFDLTVIVLAVNQIGRATAIGYQHFKLMKNTEELEIPFGDSLAPGTYELNVDAVAEVAASNSIYRVRLVPKEGFEVPPGT